MVPGRGFEPRFTASKAAVLPLDDPGLREQYDKSNHFCQERYTFILKGFFIVFLTKEEIPPIPQLYPFKNFLTAMVVVTTPKRERPIHCAKKSTIPFST